VFLYSHSQFLSQEKDGWHTNQETILLKATDIPALNNLIRSGQVAYHIRDGVHDLTIKDWNLYMDFADTVFKQSN
jgi:hypothetical protein